jgi:NhaP-type Na+/H+ or K+/H+ antiporter
MKCPDCGKEVDEGFPYCPWCGSKTVTKDDAATFRRIAVEEKLKDLRRDEISWAVIAVLSVIGGFVILGLRVHWADILAYTSLGDVLIVLGSVFVAFGIVAIVPCYRKGKQRKDFVSRLEKGKLE